MQRVRRVSGNPTDSDNGTSTRLRKCGNDTRHRTTVYDITIAFSDGVNNLGDQTMPLQSLMLTKLSSIRSQLPDVSVNVAETTSVGTYTATRRRFQQHKLHSLIVAAGTDADV